MDDVYEKSKEISSFSICHDLPDVDLHTAGVHEYQVNQGGSRFVLEIVDSCEDYLGMSLHVHGGLLLGLPRASARGVRVKRPIRLYTRLRHDLLQAS